MRSPRLPLMLVFMTLVAGLLPTGGQTAGERRTLAGVFEPEMIAVAGGELYVVEKASILVYSLNDLGLLRKIGRAGEGPGEFKPADYWYNTVTVLAEEIFVDGLDKTARFSKDGRLLKEAKKPIGVGRMVPVGENFVGVNLDRIEGDVQYQCLLLYDANGTLIKEIARQESPIQSMNRKTEMIPDVLNFAVEEDLIFVDKSREGFVFDVFDDGGAFQYRIEKKLDKIAITQVHEDEAVEKFKADPFVKRLGFEKFKQLSQFVWPKTLPAIRDFTVADGRIYARTSGTRDGREDWLVMNLKGSTLGAVSLPRVDSAPLMATLYGINYYAIRDHKLYYIKDNETTDAWELFIEEIQPRERDSLRARRR